MAKLPKLTKAYHAKLLLFGVISRLDALDVERKQLLKEFPAARTLLNGREKASKPAEPPAASPTSRKRKHRMSPSERKAVSVRMKKYWAARKAAATK